MKKTTIALAAIFTTALCGCNNCNTPEKAVTQFYKASQAHNTEEALKYTNVSESEREIVESVFNSINMEIHDFEVLNTTIEEGDTTATVEMRLHVSSPESLDTLTSTPITSCIKTKEGWIVKLM